MKTKCPKCNHFNANIHAVYGVLPCDSCKGKDLETAKHLQPIPEFAVVSKRERIVSQRDKFEQDMLSPWIGKEWKPNPDFIKHNQKTKEGRQLIDQYFTKDQLNEL